MDGDRDDGAPVSERIWGMSSSWQRMPFSDAVEVNPRRTVLRGTFTPFVDMAALPAEAHGISVLRTKPVDGGGSRFANGDTLFARITPCTENGKTGLVDCLAAGEVATGSTEFIVLAPRFNLTLPRFVYYLAKDPTFRSFAISRMRGTSGRQRVPVTVFDEFEVGVPPLPEQRRIAAILSSVDDAIEKTRAVIDQVPVVKRGLMQELFTRGLPGRHMRFKRTEIGEIPEEWKLMPLGDVGSWSSGGTPSKRQPEYWNGAIPWVSPKDMKQSRIDDAIDHVSKTAIDKGTRVTPRDSILVVVRGMILAHTFPVALTLTDVAFNQDIKALVPNEHFAPEFLLYWLESQQKRIISLVDSSSHGTKRLPTSKLFAESVPCPQLDEQENIAQLLRSHDLYGTSATVAREGMITVKTALMSTLLTGELRVTPNTEIA